ncbi:hypothetical protein [Microcoleus sp. CAWBG58]|uniref:hypothetical protein n=1 Tax=Microcoleus sp. CAWBG58 TaxID=2841651 RepID=UPI0025E45D99|nr:hypothetical protein [Microcoleus sp. CAWBG58]
MQPTQAGPSEKRAKIEQLRLEYRLLGKFDRKFRWKIMAGDRARWCCCSIETAKR